MNIAKIKNLDIANGPGIRLSVFVSGCTRGCPGCFNTEAQDFGYGTPYTVNVESEITSMLENPNIAGLSLLGGEPLEPANQPTVRNIVNACKIVCPEKSIWLFTGYTFEELTSSLRNPYLDDILRTIDVMVDGPFIQSRSNLMLKYRGSENQRLLDVPKSLETGYPVYWKDKFDLF